LATEIHKDPTRTLWLLLRREFVDCNKKLHSIDVPQSWILMKIEKLLSNPNYDMQMFALLQYLILVSFILQIPLNSLHDIWRIKCWWIKCFPSWRHLWCMKNKIWTSYSWLFRNIVWELFNHFNDNNRMSSSQVFATFFVYEYFLVTPTSNYPIANKPNDDEPLSKNLFVAN
jgi:hypothetical protein